MVDIRVDHFCLLGGGCIRWMGRPVERSLGVFGVICWMVERRSRGMAQMRNRKPGALLSCTRRFSWLGLRILKKMECYFGSETCYLVAIFSLARNSGEI